MKKTTSYSTNTTAREVVDRTENLLAKVKEKHK
jgi:hypothetical protein